MPHIGLEVSRSHPSQVVDPLSDFCVADVIYGTQWCGWKMACLGSIIALLASHGSLALRPPVFTYLFIVIFLHFILSFSVGRIFQQSFIGLVLGEII